MKSISILLLLLPCILSFEGTVDYTDQTHGVTLAQVENFNLQLTFLKKKIAKKRMTLQPSIQFPIMRLAENQLNSHMSILSE